MKMIYCLLASVLVCLSACTPVQSNYRFEVVYPNTPHVKFEFMTAQEEKSGIVLHGALFHKPKSPVRESGHIDIAIYDTSGTLICETTANYKTPINGNYEWSKVGVNFWAPLNMTPPPGSLIKLAFHVNKEWKNTPTEHGVNIAR